MAVIYVFDGKKKLKKPVSVVELIHHEGDYEAEAELRAADKPENGDYFGFRCIDGRFRMFLITRIESRDQNDTCVVTGADAAVAELDSRIVRRITLKGTTAGAVIVQSLEDSAWELGDVTADMDAEIYQQDKTYSSRWTGLKAAADYGSARVIPYYVFEDGAITGRKVDVIDKAPIFRGMIITRKRGAQNIRITEEGTPYGRVYAVGKPIANTDPAEQTNIASAVWSVANGDPVDKPEGQDWVALPDAQTDAEYVFESRYEDDPQRLLEKAYADLVSKQKPKASGTAQITDVEYLPGFEHRKLRMWDKAVVRTAGGLTVETTVTGIDRYYVQKELTKLTVGDEKAVNLEGMLAQMQADVKSAGRGAGGASAGAEEVRVITLQALDRIELLSKEILLKATHTEVQELAELTTVQHNTVLVNLDAVNARLDLAATATQVDNLNNVVTDLSAQLTVQAGQISTRVSRNGVISAINQTPETITINASRINLTGYVTASELSAQVATINSFFTGNATASWLDAAVLRCNLAKVTEMTLHGFDTEWKSGDFVTAVTFPKYKTVKLEYLNWNGNKTWQTVLLPATESAGSVTKGTSHKYLGRKVDG